MFVQFHHSALAATPAISLARVALGLGKCGVTERGHDVMRAHVSIGEYPAKCLTQPMRLAAERQSGSLDCVPHKAAEAVDGERLAKLGIDDCNVLTRRRLQRLPQIVSDCHFDRHAGLVARVGRVAVDLVPGQRMGINALQYPC